jgi:NADPH:quinone reductase-like Zn-dependent oxidoreductase
MIMSGSMKAVRIHQYGGTEVLRYEDAPQPEPQPGEILVRVHAAGINPVDWKTRAGSGMSGRYGEAFPMIPGWDVSGVVETVASDVSAFKPGDEVFGMVRFPDIGSAYAEYVAAPAAHFALKPSTVDHVQAAAVPLAALTAWQALFEAANLSAGQRILILGASGGVGHLAAQVAKWKGAYTIGTSSTANLDFLQTLGVDESVDYTRQRLDEAIAPVDLVLDTVGGDIAAQAYALVKPGGSFVSIVGAANPEKGLAGEVTSANILVHTSASQMAQIADLMAEGCLQASISEVFPLTEVAQAHEFGQNRPQRRGKLVLQVI